ncbi:hypothetical protein THAOC_31959, partial [Thalassiosira oceanica]
DRAGFFETVKQVAATEVPVPTASPFRFEFSAEAADHNTTVLESYDFDLAKVIDDSGGDLCRAQSAKPHPRQPRQSPPAHPPPDGRYKRSDPPKKHENQHVTKLTRTDVKNGYAVPITAKGVRRFKDAEVHPAGLQHQNTTHGRLINEGGGKLQGRQWDVACCMDRPRNGHEAAVQTDLYILGLSENMVGAVTEAESNPPTGSSSTDLSPNQHHKIRSVPLSVDSKSIVNVSFAPPGPAHPSLRQGQGPDHLIILVVGSVGLSGPALSFLSHPDPRGSPTLQGAFRVVELEI